MKSEVGIIHLSDIQFGDKHRFNWNETSQETVDDLLEKTIVDISDTCGHHDLPLDMIIHSGDLAETGAPSELKRGFDFLGKLSSRLQIPLENVIITPGNHDISWVLCRQARERAQLEGRPFQPPYSEKFSYYNEEYRKFYRMNKIEESLFSVRVHREIGVLTIALNSCYMESELDCDHYGDLGPTQLHMALKKANEVDPLFEYIRIVVLHHGLKPNLKSPEDSLREPERVVQACQDYSCRLILHGHTHVPRAYVEGLPHKPLVYIMSSGSTGLAHHTLPDLPNHYSLIKLQTSNLTRFHRQFSSRLIDEKTGYGRWSTDSSEFEGGKETITFDHSLDSFDISKQKSGGSNKNIFDIIRHCKWETSNEIQRVAKSKYIKDLYIGREIESALNNLLISDQLLATRLSEIKDSTYKIVSNAKNEESTIRKRAKKEEEERLSKETKSSSTTHDIIDQKKRLRERLAKVRKKIEQGLLIDGKLNNVLADGKPCSGKYRECLQELLTDYEALRHLLEDGDHSAINNALNILRPASRNIIVVVDRAGGGKTNLLCHLADLNSRAEPTIFIGGRLQILTEDALIDAVAEKMGCPQNENSLQYIESINVLLEEAACHATIFIDGINENRDIAGLSGAIDKFRTAMGSSRFRLVLTCRDIYWNFFEDQPYVSDSSVIRGNLYAFSAREQDQALRVYLNYFNIEVDLGPLALERCRHPLLLRFFCEAYSSQNREKTKLGRVPEIRLKPLFDDYWHAKIKHLANSSLNASNNEVEGCIYNLIAHMLHSNTASLTTDQIPSVTGVHDLRSEDSVYLGLLDEDIIIEETPTSDVDIRRVVFVYEEFMEYAGARYLQASNPDWSSADIDELFSSLKDKKNYFVNVLGITEYLCAFYLENKRNDLAYRLLVNMAEAGWSQIVTNVFAKYDNATTMILSVLGERFSNSASSVPHKCKDIDLQGIKLILEQIGNIQRTLMSELCVLICLYVLLPRYISFAQIGERSPLVDFRSNQPQSFIITDTKNARCVIKMISSFIVEKDIHSIRNDYWKGWAGRKGYIDSNDRSTLLRSSINLLQGAPRRLQVISFAFNGLFDEQADVRKTCAYLTRDLDSEFAILMRRKHLALETDKETIRFLQNSLNSN